jgi:hypothetical protein
MACSQHECYEPTAKRDFDADIAEKEKCANPGDTIHEAISEKFHQWRKFRNQSLSINQKEGGVLGY